MSETIPNQDNGTERSQTDEHERALENARLFIEKQLPVLSKITGLDVEASVGKGWSTDMKTGRVSIDPSFFVERGYSPEHATFATFHEFWAHLREVQREPTLVARQMRFMGRNQSNHLFLNILSDIHGNKLMGRVLPAMQDVAADIYDNRLFPLVDEKGQPVDYSSQPMHIQFLYKMIRDEMIPDSDTPVRDEVRAELDKLREYQGAGDAIAYLTTPNTKLKSEERFDLQLAHIYPVYQKLLEQDKEEAKDKPQEQDGQPGEQQDGGDASAEQQSSSDADQNSQEQNSGQPGGRSDFDDAYKDYFENKHPEPMSHEEHDKLEEAIKQAARGEKTKQAPVDPNKVLDAKLRKETGHGLNERKAYRAEVAKHIDSINRMRDVFRTVINERVAAKRRLSRRAHTDGPILDPDRLAQTVIDAKSGINQPDAFKRYEMRNGPTEAIGNTDYFFLFDGSASMQGPNAQSAATSAVILLEGLAGVERDIQSAEHEHDIDLELDIKTGLYVFGQGSTCLKPLSGGLSDKERMDTRAKVIAADDYSTDDFHALEQVLATPRDADRKRIIIVVSDGGSSDAARARRVIDQLRDQDDYVYCVGIESPEATKLYAPHAQVINDPSELPDVLEAFIESTVR